MPPLRGCQRAPVVTCGDVRVRPSSRVEPGEHRGLDAQWKRWRLHESESGWHRTDACPLIITAQRPSPGPPRATDTTWTSRFLSLQKVVRQGFHREAM